MSLQDLCISTDHSIIQAMQAIDRGGLEVALVVHDGGRLHSVVTDGDIRRAILNGRLLSDGVEHIGTHDFTAISTQTTRDEAVRLMVERGIKCLPVLDQDGRVVDVRTMQGCLIPKRKNWAVIMAGGKGERLGDLTHAIPKPLLPVGGAPIIERLVQQLVGHGIQQVFVSVNYLGRQIEDHLGDGSRYGCSIQYLREDPATPLGTAGSLALLPEVPAAPLLVVNGDLVTGLNFGRLIDAGRSHAATVVVRHHHAALPFGVLTVSDGLVSAVQEKPSISYTMNAGIYLLSPDVISSFLRGQTRPTSMTDLLVELMRFGMSIAAYPMDEAWHDVGTPESFNAIAAGFTKVSIDSVTTSK